MSSESLHVPAGALSREGRLLHYAVTSLKEELDAIDWYRQRADDSDDAALRELLLHNMREEMEHAAMLIEWLRRNNDDFAGHVKTYLFTEAPIVGIERVAEAGDEPAADAVAAVSDRITGVTIGSLKGAG
jgi:uncharacterized protein